MKRIYLSILVIIPIIFGCSENVSVESVKLTGKSLNSLILSAVNGDKKANDSLSVLIDLQMAENNLYNSLVVDSFQLDTVKYFTVLLEYSNPTYNRFSIYDEYVNCYLIDKSLNGKIYSKVLDVHPLQMIELVESFLNEDSLRLVRVSLYKKIDDSFALVYRSFAELNTIKYKFNQTIYSISPDSIKTKLLVPKKYRLETNENYFVYDSIEKCYQSESSLFDSLVYKVINENKKDLY